MVKPNSIIESFDFDVIMIHPPFIKDTMVL